MSAAAVAIGADASAGAAGFPARAITVDITRPHRIITGVPIAIAAPVCIFGFNRQAAANAAIAEPLG